jgi:hypothetical protein
LLLKILLQNPVSRDDNVDANVDDLLLVCRDCVGRYGNDSFLSTLDIKGQFVRRLLYKNLLHQGRDVTAMIALGDLDADGKFKG